MFILVGLVAVTLLLALNAFFVAATSPTRMDIWGAILTTTGRSHGTSERPPD